MKKLLRLFVFLPVIVRAVDHAVPVGSRGNRFVFTVANASSQTLQNPSVKITSSPDWLFFGRTEAAADSLPKGSRRDFAFEFDAAEGESGRKGEVHFTVSNGNGSVVSRKSISMKAVLAEEKTTLYPPFPNPANPSATLRYALAESGRVRIEIRNVLGQSVCTLLDGEKPAGLWSVTWNGRDNRGRIVTSGVYVAVLETETNGRSNRCVARIMVQR
jgi:hypothetical protein